MTILLFAEKLLSVIVGAKQFIKIKTRKRRPRKNDEDRMCRDASVTRVPVRPHRHKSVANDANHIEVQIMGSTMKENEFIVLMYPKPTAAPTMTYSPNSPQPPPTPHRLYSAHNGYQWNIGITSHRSV